VEHNNSLDQILSSQLFDIARKEEVNSEKLLDAISHRVNYLLEFQPELLFSYLYRLDVEESKVRFIIETSRISNKVEALSRLIFDRQMMRYKTKQSLPQEPIEGWQW
jgi:hypothetical protein